MILDSFADPTLFDSCQRFSVGGYQVDQAEISSSQL